MTSYVNSGDITSSQGASELCVWWFVTPAPGRPAWPPGPTAREPHFPQQAWRPSPPHSQSSFSSTVNTKDTVPGTQANWANKLAAAVSCDFMWGLGLGSWQEIRTIHPGDSAGTECWFVSWRLCTVNELQSNLTSHTKHVSTKRFTEGWISVLFRSSEGSGRRTIESVLCFTCNQRCVCILSRRDVDA